MPDFGLTDQGFVAPRSVDLLDQIRSEYETRTGLTIEWADDIFLGVMTQVIAEVMGRQSEMLQAIADSRDPDNATGHQLDTLAALVGISRIPAEFSAVDLTLAGDAGTIIDQGSEVEHPNGSLWYTQDTVVIEPGGTVDVQVRPDETGPIAATATDEWEINSPVDGWDTAESTDDATPGRLQETDAQLRFRRSQSLQILAGGSIAAIRANILEIEGVQAAIVVDNDGDQPDTVAGLTLPGKSMAVIVYPVLTTDQSEALAAEIYRRKSAGIETIGDESATVTGADGFEKTVRWFIADEIAVDVGIEYTADVDLDDEIEEAIADYFDGLLVGERVRVLAILGILDDIDGVISATVELNGGTLDIEPEITEIAVEGAISVDRV